MIPEGNPKEQDDPSEQGTVVPKTTGARSRRKRGALPKFSGKSGVALVWRRGREGHFKVHIHIKVQQHARVWGLSQHTLGFDVLLGFGVLSLTTLRFVIGVYRNALGFGVYHNNNNNNNTLGLGVYHNALMFWSL